MHNDVERVLLSREKLENIVNSLAKQIEKDYNGKEFIMVGLLKGVFVFMAELITKIDMDFEVDFMEASSYEGTQSTGEVKISKDISISVTDRDVLIVDDIVDTGLTLSFVTEHLLSKGASSVKVCALCDKPDRRKVPFTPDYRGAQLPDEFVVGYGLDYDEKYRNLPYIGVLKSSVYNKQSTGKRSDPHGK